MQKFKQFLFCFAIILSLPLCWGGTSVLIWPIDPVLEDYQNATAVWLENKGDSAGYFQIRAFKWRQENNEDIYVHKKKLLPAPLLP